GDDGMGVNPNDGCEPLTNNVTGLIVLVDRGNCNFTVKVENAQAKGAMGIVIANNSTQAGMPAPGMGGTPTGPITIAPMSTTYEDGMTIKAAIATGPTQLHLLKVKDIERDG